MAEQFLTLMADLDTSTQARLDEWYGHLRQAGFTGAQTPGLPFHISLAVFPTDMETEAVDVMRSAASAFAPVPVHLSHIGMFAGGKVLFCTPERDGKLNALHEACDPGFPQTYPWTPHVTVLIDGPETVQKALPLLIKDFTPLSASIVRLHLCAIWPTRESGAAERTGNG